MVLNIIELDKMILETIQKQENPIEHIEGINIAEKVGKYCYNLKYEENRLKIIADEYERLKILKSEQEDRIKKMKDNIKNKMLLKNITKIEYGSLNINLSNGGHTINITDEKSVPAEFKIQKITESISKTNIEKHIKETGEIPEGTEYVPVYRLIIK